MPEPNFSLDEFVKELGTRIEPEGFSARELAERHGYGERQAERTIKRQIDAGILEMVGMRRGLGSDGIMRRTVPVYRMKKKDKK